MTIHYGYTDGRGEFYIAIDTERCDGCRRCAEECPEKVFEMTRDDRDRRVVKVRDEMVRSIGYVCPGSHACTLCHGACDRDAISHSW